MCQRFYANPSTRFEHANGAVAYGPGGPLDCLGRYSRVENCPIRYLHVDGHDHHWFELDQRYTAYATGYAETHFSVPAATRVKGTYLNGYFTNEEGSTVFVITSNKGRAEVTDGKVRLLRRGEWIVLSAKEIKK